MKSYSNGTTVFIEIPLEILKFAQENNPTRSCKISDQQKMGRWFSENILEFGDDGERDPKFYELIDDMFDEAIESGENWIEYIEATE